tara:strand:+ start:191 stop:376 length:186 start_codon:yes stop_codon:yes gene_type:complete
MVSLVQQIAEVKSDRRVRDWDEARLYLEPIIQRMFNDDLKAGRYQKAERLHAAWLVLTEEI